jgi:hypothetical protein
MGKQKKKQRKRKNELVLSPFGYFLLGKASGFNVSFSNVNTSNVPQLPSTFNIQSVPLTPIKSSLSPIISNIVPINSNIVPLPEFHPIHGYPLYTPTIFHPPPPPTPYSVMLQSVPIPPPIKPIRSRNNKFFYPLN